MMTGGGIIRSPSWRATIAQTLDVHSNDTIAVYQVHPGVVVDARRHLLFPDPLVLRPRESTTS